MSLRTAAWADAKRGVEVRTPELIHDLMLLQGGRCACCNEPLGDSYDVEHNPITGFIRGLTCGVCNRTAIRSADRLWSNPFGGSRVAERPTSTMDAIRIAKAQAYVADPPRVAGVIAWTHSTCQL